MTTVAGRPIERTIVGMILRHSLTRVDFSITETGIYAAAIPKAYHPQVAKNRQAKLEKAAAESGGSISLEHAQRITNETMKAPIAEAHGEFATMGDALKQLEKALKALK